MKNLIQCALFLSSFNLASLGTLDERLDPIVIKEYGTRLAQPTLSHTEIVPGAYLIECDTICGNSLLVYGKEGAILINSMLAKMLPWLRKEIRDVSGINNIKILISSNPHFWNTNANGLFGGMMDFMISHQNTRDRILQDSTISDLNILPNYFQERHVDNAGARITFEDKVRINFNNEKIDLMHMEKASTDGDLLVHFTEKNVIFIGDIATSNGLPFVNNNAGGSVEGTLAALKKALDLGNENTVFIPSLGQAMSFKQLKRYINKLDKIYLRIDALKKEGLSVLEILNDREIKNQLITFKDNFISSRENYIKRHFN